MRRLSIVVSLILIPHLLNIGASTLQAQPYPSRPVQIVVPYDPGSAVDMLARQCTDELGKNLRTPVTVLNKPGAASTLGTDFVVKSRKDGYTILYAATSAVVYARISSPEIVPYDPVKDLEPLGFHCYFPLAIAVQESSPWKTFKELVDYARRNPGSVSFGIQGQGSIDHFDLELIKSLTGTQFNAVPFKGPAAIITALLGGHVDAIVIANSLVGPHVKAGKLRVLLITNKMPEYPNTPAITELGYNQNLLSAWSAWFAPAGIAEEVKKILVSAVEKTVTNPDLVGKIEKLGYIVAYKRPEDLKKIMTSDYETARALAIRFGLSK